MKIWSKNASYPLGAPTSGPARSNVASRPPALTRSIPFPRIFTFLHLFSLNFTYLHLSVIALISGERARPGRSSARPRAEHEGVGRPKMMRQFLSVHVGRESAAHHARGKPSGQDMIIETEICEII